MKNLFLILACFCCLNSFLQQKAHAEEIALPAPTYTSDTSIEEALKQRRSVRQFQDTSLVLSEVSQLLWAGQGVTSKSGFRTAPSAGALFPIEIYLVAGKVKDLAVGVYKYHPHTHTLKKISDDDPRAELASAALEQKPVQHGAIVIVLAAAYERSTAKYGRRGFKYAHIEAGNVSQNIYLQAQSLGLGTTFIGAFYDKEVREIINMTEEERPMGIMPVGRPR